VSLERGVCSCAELQAFSCYRDWKEACQATRVISTTSRRELSSSFFPPCKTPKEIHAILIETLGEHAPSYATVINWVAQFKRGDFSTCDAPRPGRPKTVTTLGIIDQIHELILEEMPERGSKTSTVPVVRASIGIFSAWPKWFLVETWLYHHDPETKQINNQWSGGIAAHPAPKNSESKNSLEKFSPRFLGSRRHPPHWLSSKGPNYQREVLLVSAGAVEGYLERKMPREGNQSGHVLSRQCPCSPGTCNPEETGLPGLPISWSPTPFYGSGPVGLPPVPWTEKTIERWPFFIRRGGHCCREDLVKRTNIWVFFEWFAKARATG